MYSYTSIQSNSDVGTSKAETLKRYMKATVPWASVIAVTEMFRGSEADRLILFDSSNSGSNSNSNESSSSNSRIKPDFVLDCIDDVNTKGELLAYCVSNNIPVLTSMGAGGKG